MKSRTRILWPALAPRTWYLPLHALRLSVVCALMMLALVPAYAQEPSIDTEAELIKVLTSDAPPAEKAITCKRLVIYGTKNSVPALAALLSNPELASWARIPLEAIPDPAADQALRKAMTTLQGNLLVGVINSIAYRRDTRAVGKLVRRVNDPDREVASAAAIALGRIASPPAGRALTRSLASGRPEVRPAIAQGCVLCAEDWRLHGKSKQAVKLFDTVRAADLPKQRLLEATRGAILARGSAGLPLLIEQLRSHDKAYLGIGLSTARELPGQPITEALAAEMRQAAPDRQSFILLAIADRQDAAVLPTVLEAARNGSPKLRLAAVKVLDRLGDPKAVPVLLEAAAGSEADLVSPAIAALARLPGNEVDADLLGRLGQAQGKTRQVLIQVAAQRRINGALPAILAGAQDADQGVSAAAIDALGAFGDDKHASELVKILTQTKDSTQRERIEEALVAISGRNRTGCVPHLIKLTQNSDSGLRIIGLHALASAGGADALAGVKTALQDTDEAVQDEAVRTLATWPNNWPDDTAVAEPLLALAKSATKPSHQTLGLRGYLQCLKSDKQLKNEEKVAKVNELLPVIKRPEEQRLAIAALDTVPTTSALELVLSFVGQSDVTEDACLALVSLADKDRPGLTQDQRQKALQTVLDKSTSDSMKAKAQKMLQAIQ